MSILEARTLDLLCSTWRPDARMLPGRRTRRIAIRDAIVRDDSRTLFNAREVDA